ncbi:MAG: hypothetical protein PVI90_03970, partial [Desulfobacteraceae bacterium]
MKRNLLGILYIVLFLVLLGISLTAEIRMTFLFIYFSYFFILLLVLVWGISIVRLIKSLNLSLKEAVRQFGTGMIVAFLLTLVVVFTVKTDYRTLSDETNLLSVSKSMTFAKNIKNITIGKYYYDNFKTLGSTIPKRPFVYPFLTSIVHSIIGFQGSNCFFVNYCALFFFLAGIFIIFQRYVDGLSALSALFMVLACPVVTLYASCGGFDFINAFFFYLVFAALFFYFKAPTKEKFVFVWMTFIVMSNTRYESIIYWIIACVGMVLFGYIKWKTIKKHFCLLSATPFLMLPFIWQRILMQGKHENPPGVSPFGPEHFLRQFNEFLTAQLDFSFYLPYANLLNLIAFVGIGVLIWGLITNWKKKIISSSTLQFACILAVCILANLLFTFCYYYGRYTHPISARYFILITLMLALIPILVKAVTPKLIGSGTMLVLSLVMFFLYHPIAMEDRFTNTLTQNREFRQSRKFVNALNNQQILLITNRPGQFTALDYGAVRFSYANQNVNTLKSELDKGLYS